MKNYGDLGGFYLPCLNDQYNQLAGFDLVRLLPPHSFTRCCDKRVSCISSYIDLSTDLWSTFFVFNSVVAIYKCLGHTYDFGSVSVYSYYLVIENNQRFPGRAISWFQIQVMDLSRLLLLLIITPVLTHFIWRQNCSVATKTPGGIVQGMNLFASCLFSLGTYSKKFIMSAVF